LSSNSRSQDKQQSKHERKDDKTRTQRS
jgi:hypothetical protein